MTNDVERGGDSLGARIRALRKSRGVSLRDLGQRIGVSASHVSQVERGMASFSVPILYRVASELEISMDGLFESGDAVPPRREQGGATGENGSRELTPESGLDGIVLRAADRKKITLADGPRWERLTPEPEARSEFLEVYYEPFSGRTAPLEFTRHDGREYGVILEGKLHVQVGFEETVLSPGDSICFDSRVPHRFTNQGGEPVRAIWFVREDHDHFRSEPTPAAPRKSGP
ncbi:helix-turn-helix domain-containing protein [Arthrobacter nitrophenolicus]|uniref:XRE family transcriptional regulator n=1 Tax=Arthrobacter nitrophenolicus TaxID=683150 RepID=A0A4R5XLA8_9MICC|nr:XRE family transcriptional regulator [Arthrobacter nitrophenolicus]TDL31585.1 XRE family transcriptional regulator [Arthrobacter nitrophenolicus]